jgi:hypothetical protein
MNTKVSHKPIKLRNKFSLTETYYTFPHWDSREIDGVEFIPVNKFYPSPELKQQVHYMRKDSLEKVR